jgi:CcmD family protein
MSNSAWLVVALAITFLAIGGYTLSLATRKRALEQRAEELEKRARSRAE